jgi:hypothetical protein
VLNWITRNEDESEWVWFCVCVGGGGDVHPKFLNLALSKSDFRAFRPGHFTLVERSFDSLRMG